MEIFLTYGISVNRMLRNQKTYSNKYEAYVLPKANPAFAIYKFHEGKKMSEITEISGYNHLLQPTWKAHRWHAKVTGWARNAWGAWPSCHAGLGLVQSPLESREHRLQMDVPPYTQPQFVMSGCASPTIRTSSPASQP